MLRREPLIGAIFRDELTPERCGFLGLCPGLRGVTTTAGGQSWVGLAAPALLWFLITAVLLNSTLLSLLATTGSPHISEPCSCCKRG